MSVIALRMSKVFESKVSRASLQCTRKGLSFKVHFFETQDPGPKLIGADTGDRVRARHWSIARRNRPVECSRCTVMPLNVAGFDGALRRWAPAGQTEGDRIRTCSLLSRSQMLYPIELHPLSPGLPGRWARPRGRARAVSSANRQTEDDRSRTCNLLIRSQVLYPIELHPRVPDHGPGSRAKGKPDGPSGQGPVLRERVRIGSGRGSGWVGEGSKALPA